METPSFTQAPSGEKANTLRDDPRASITVEMFRTTWKKKPIHLDGRGIRPTGNGKRKRCPYCGKNMSHGLPGNPLMRRMQPCQLKAGTE